MSAQGIATEDPHLLIVDDDERLRELLQRFLSSNGYRVSAAADAAGARALMKSYDLPWAFAKDSAFAKYGRIWRLPLTFVIDRKGRVAAAYMAGLVDRDNIEANIKAVLSDRE